MSRIHSSLQPLASAASEPAAPVEKGAESAGADHSAEGLAVATHVGPEGEEMTCITTAEFKKILAWYQEEMEAKERRAKWEADLESFDVDP